MTANPMHVLLQAIPFGVPCKWYKSAKSARELLEQFPDFTFSHLEWESYAWPGGYEIAYLTHCGGLLCHQCANANLKLTIDPDTHDWYIVDADIHWEGSALSCDHCNREIQSAYGDPSKEVA